MKIKYLYLLSICALISCNGIYNEEGIEEDYKTLFPEKEIEKPENKKGNLIVNMGNHKMPIENYVYPGLPTPKFGADTYDITLKFEFKELDYKGYLVGEQNVSAKYEIRYINKDKKLVRIFSSNKQLTTPQGGGEERVMVNGKEETITFKVQSGFPIYLCVKGVGPRGSSVKASIGAVSADKLIVIPPLQTEQFQNQEGPNELLHPYCSYIILP